MKYLLFVFASFLIACAPSVQSETPSAAPTLESIPQSYKECVAMGGQILKTYPAKCVYKYGETFVDDSKPNKLCKNKCGDGICAEIVCLGSGCPCAESQANCPADCR